MKYLKIIPWLWKEQVPRQLRRHRGQQGFPKLSRTVEQGKTLSK